MNRETTYVLTVYNKAAFLPAVLAAVEAEQAVTGGEIVIVDDGSTDESLGLIRRFALDNPAVLVITQPNRGVAAATNTGLKLANCPYIRLIDGDDCPVAGSTVILQGALAETGAGFAFGRQVYETSPPDSSPPRLIINPLRLMLTNQPFIPSVTLGRRELVQACLPLPLGYATAQDFALGLALAEKTSFAISQTPCCLSPAQSGGLSGSKARMFQDTASLCLEYAARQSWGQAERNYALQRNAGRARNYLRRHLPQEKRAIRRASRIALLAKLPLSWPFDRWMTEIAKTYQPAVADYRNHA